MISILLSLIYLLGILLLLILVVPISIDFQGEFRTQLALMGRVKWGKGLFSLQIMHYQGHTNLTFKTLGFYRPVASSRQGTDKEIKKSKARKPSRRSPRLSSLLNREFWLQVKLLAKRLRGAMHLDLRLAGVYGFDDPALTGLAAAVIASTLWSNGTVFFNPDFTQETFDFQGSVRGWFIPLQIIIIVVWFLTIKPVRIIWWPMTKQHKKHKEAVQYA